MLPASSVEMTDPISWRKNARLVTPTARCSWAQTGHSFRCSDSRGGSHRCEQGLRPADSGAGRQVHQHLHRETCFSSRMNLDALSDRLTMSFCASIICQSSPTGARPSQYNQRLAEILDGLSTPTFVDGKHGSFQYHAQPFQFGATELAGLKIFLRVANGAADGSQHAGNCAACHQAPNFSDFSLHNTAVSQEEYDAANGPGAFAGLAIPLKAERDQNYDLYLPATVSPHPRRAFPPRGRRRQSSIRRPRPLECLFES